MVAGISEGHLKAVEQWRRQMAEDGGSEMAATWAANLGFLGFVLFFVCYGFGLGL
ncbi:hypothetical protein J1N35_013099 [Gossypium stocksii]|uniref:Uncharacterized protein n=1 Tax=Gossypium stocksii TaxID=47602 RepID=A0A9D3VT80_9ROSI|nr:hypothetical protein J1N35_013099 [Gossypium stocksii]